MREEIEVSAIFGQRTEKWEAVEGVFACKKVHSHPIASDETNFYVTPTKRETFFLFLHLAQLRLTRKRERNRKKISSWHKTIKFGASCELSATVESSVEAVNKRWSNRFAKQGNSSFFTWTCGTNASQYQFKISKTNEKLSKEDYFSYSSWNLKCQRFVFIVAGSDCSWSRCWYRMRRLQERLSGLWAACMEVSFDSISF